ncbi:MAG: RNA-binding protein [Coriobacteriaceae bacterium]|nr:RNA-binding protein [Coriobacteriaceae bacterium]
MGPPGAGMSRRPLLVIDGYNVIGAEPGYRSADDDLEEARARLVADAAVFAQDEWRCTVVFDGGGNPDSDGVPHHVSGVAIVFSAYGRTADDVIEALAARSRGRGEPMTVVTSDAATQSTVFGGPVMRMSAREFAASVARGASAWREHTPTSGRRGAVETRVSQDVRRRLDRMARGGT